MVIADTSIWIEFLHGNEFVVSSLLKIFSQNRLLTTECIFGEILYGAKNKQEEEFILGYWSTLPKVHSDNLFIEGGILAAKEKFHTKGVSIIDSAIVTAARRQEAQIWTLDKKMLSLLKPREIFKPSS